MSDSDPSRDPEPVTGRTFRDDDLYGEDFADRRYVECVFRHVDMTEATSRGAVFQECAFGNVRLNASRHVDSAFLRCVFERCDLFDAEFTGCKMIGSTFRETALRPLRIEGGDWSFVSLAGADLRGISVRGVRMREVDLTGAKCDDAVFADIDLSGGQLRGVSFVRTDLRGSDLTALDPRATELRGALIDPEQALVIARSLGLEIRWA